jgi:hypothetical protein
MPRAVLKNGVIFPLEPLPPQWADGRELRVDAAIEDEDVGGFDAWVGELQTLIAQNDPSDLARVEQVIKDADEQAKASVRKEMG